MSIFRTVRLAIVATVLIGAATAATAQNTNSSIATTRHNLSASGTGTVKATSENQICVFCHTPHAANTAAPSPLWNRTLSAETYTPYTSSSLDSATILGGQLGQPGGSSKLCLSCHDGTLALGTVSNMPGSGSTGSIAMGGTGTGGTMPDGSGATTGFTRKLGTDLRNDHPISFTFNSTLSTRDGELRTPPFSAGGNLVVGTRSGGAKPLLPLDHQNHVQCTTCHDPHLAGDSIKFLRLNRLQQNASPGVTFNAANDQICLGCHDKLGNSWAQSAHANSTAATQTYKATSATQREFPANTQVWQAACLNCHDTHTVQGARRLLREGTDGAGSPRAGGNPALENTCYQCHTTIAASVINNGTFTASTGVPDIATEFNKAIKMPIASLNQAAAAETHDIGGNFNDATFIDCTNTSNGCGKDFIESREKLGANNHGNRHVECTDCHNPHRVLKNALFNGQGSNTRRTHVPGGADGNLASGALRGTWGVEPTWTKGTTWPEVPTNYTVKRGDPGSGTATDRAQAYLTREYQLCLKCHSDFGAGTTMPLMTNSTGGTASNTNSIGTRWTNVAAEFTVAANEGGTGADQGASNDTNQRRSWHPVHFPTGRNRAARGMNSTGDINLRAPFAAGIGAQTMHCSDCHGSDGSWTTDSGPNLATVQGPHGSGQNFLLKGSWVTGSGGTTPNSPGFCGNCHNPTGASSGFASGNASHNYEDKDGAGCTFCHIAVPHGWKNKAFLVNLSCVGPENGETTGFTNGCKSKAANYTAAPYYVSARLNIASWGTSGSWSAGNCQGTTWMQDNCGSW